MRAIVGNVNIVTSNSQSSRHSNSSLGCRRRSRSRSGCCSLVRRVGRATWLGALHSAEPHVTHVEDGIDGLQESVAVDVERQVTARLDAAVCVAVANICEG